MFVCVCVCMRNSSYIVFLDYLCFLYDAKKNVLCVVLFFLEREGEKRIDDKKCVCVLIANELLK